MTTTQPLPVYQSPSRASKPLPPPPRARGYVAVVKQHPLVLAGPIMRVLVLSAALFALVGGMTAILPLTRAGVAMLLVIPVMVSVGGVGWLVWRNYQRIHTKLYFSQAGIRLRTPSSLWSDYDMMLPREQCVIELSRGLVGHLLNTGGILITTESRQLRVHWLQNFDSVRQYVDWQTFK